MSVVVDGDRITVEPEDIQLNDFLEYAELAIERFGWRQGERKNVTEGDNMVEVAEKDGLSLHDAIGYTNVMLGATEPASVGKPTGKDGATASSSATRSMRNEMTEAVKKVLPPGKNDKTFNDEAKSVEDVIAVLRLARGAA